ncbi:TetR/AcrR family transcriptional regulator [Paracoccus laeviglucosivorans]|uniref:Transcriptional regulator, TetR family n=1 Tax=Paracoccus laeviglucosivorans TaxID=1197861 RepID=A0A521ESQ1_9RHOB|nr:TetR family transcriptional regulator [Paracoccus laeviglucosivorans]SMO86973.1 transcriptional regulator, TetR family [Paracoccus laeviglucosivorans]
MTKTKRRYDPDRRDRIIDAALDVIAEHGIAGMTHRRVAERADVPLGSTTYHFAGIDDLLVEAFRRFSHQAAARYSERMAQATTLPEAREAVVDLISGGLWATQRNMMLSFELYAYAARNPRLREVLVDWMAQSRAAMQQHFPPETARILDAFLEGVTIHNTSSENLIPRSQVREIVGRLTALPD